MATVAWSITSIKQGIISAQVVLQAGDTSDQLTTPDYPDKTIQLSGTFGDSVVNVVGSNLEAGTPTFVLHQAHAPATTFSALAAAVGATVIENPRIIIANADGTTGEDLIVTVIARAPRPV